MMRGLRQLSTKPAVALALLFGATVVALTFAIEGAGMPGAAAAARNTARFSGQLLALAVAWPALGESAQQLVARRTLLYAFVAAHAVHYTSVLYLAVLDPNNHLHRLEPEALGIASFGTLLALAIALTAGAQAGTGLVVQRVAVYVAWLLFIIAFGSRLRTYAPAAPMLAVMLLAMVMRVWAAIRQRGRGAVPASP